VRGLGTIRTCVSRRAAQWVDKVQEPIGKEQKELLKREILCVCVCVCVCVQAVSPEEQDEAVSP
jgi:hypothetical protein